MKTPRHTRASITVHTDRKPSKGKVSVLMRRGSVDRVVRVGLQSRVWHDLYHRLLTLTWWKFIILASVVYLLANFLFAGLYLLQPGSIVAARPGSLLDAFFFSVETFATLGYGVLSPATNYANWIMTIETLTGIMTVALTTGVLFARVSRPTARVLFSHAAVIGVHEGKLSLMVRMGNERVSQIVDATVTLSVLKSDRTQEGHFMRRFYDVKLVRSRTPVFALSFVAIHVIDEASPLFGMDHAAMQAVEVELLVTVSGLDETMGQLVHARSSYTADEIRFDHRYVDIFGVTDDGRRAIDYARFHDTEQV
jgi:inward rectifier potassium channel